MYMSRTPHETQNNLAMRNTADVKDRKYAFLKPFLALIPDIALNRSVAYLGHTSFFFYEMKPNSKFLNFVSFIHRFENKLLIYNAMDTVSVSKADEKAHLLIK
jgi:hypothetical protein